MSLPKKTTSQSLYSDEHAAAIRNLFLFAVENDS
jgi:hypothetical protein